MDNHLTISTSSGLKTQWENREDVYTKFHNSVVVIFIFNYKIKLIHFLTLPPFNFILNIQLALTRNVSFTIYLSLPVIFIIL